MHAENTRDKYRKNRKNNKFNKILDLEKEKIKKGPKNARKYRKNRKNQQEFLIFMPLQKESYNPYPPLTVANVHLEKSFCVKYLGVYIDCHLTWHDHIDYICDF